MGGLEELPSAVLQAILDKLDLASVCSAAATCGLLRACVKDFLSRLSRVHVLRDICLSAQDLDYLLASNTIVQSLRLDCSRLVNDDGVDNLIKPSLEELALYNCETLSSDLLVKIGQHCTSLRSLELELGWQDDRPGYFAYQTGGYSRALEHLLEGCSRLEFLKLQFGGSCFDTDALAAIPRLRAGSLQALDIGLLAERDTKHLLDVGANLSAAQLTAYGGYRNLQKLSLVLDRITDSLITTISLRLPTLTDLDLCDEPTEEPLLAYDLTNAGVQQVGVSQSLRRLSLVRRQDWYPAYFKRVSDLGIFLMAEGCGNLDTIRLGGFSRITDAGCRALLHASFKLQTFEVLHMNQVTDLAFHDLSATSLSLESVGLSSCGLLSDEAMAALVLCKGLRTLNLSGCRSVGDDGLKAISTLSHLHTLSLNGTDVSDYGLNWLSKCNSALTFLSLRGCLRVTEKGIFSLFNGHVISRLESLDLSSIFCISDDVTRALVGSGVRLNELWLRDCQLLTYRSVILLAQSNCGESLRVLDLWGCRGITLFSGMWLHKPHFPRLRWLGVAWTFNVQIAVRLKKSRPSLRIRRNGAEVNDWSAGDFVETQSPSKSELDELEHWINNDG